MARMGDRRGTCMMFVGRSEGKRLLRRPRHRWRENVKMDLQEVEWQAWIVSISFRTGTGNRCL